MAASVDDYLAALSGWQAETARALRRQILAVDGVSEAFKWAQPIYLSEGPVCLIKAHKAHLTFGFWRGAQMTGLDARLVPGGSFQMASIKLAAGDAFTDDEVRRLVEAAAALNRLHGDPMKAARA